MTENDDEKIDTGEPIAEISDFTEPARTGFIHRLRNKIERRVLTAEMATLVWETPKTVFLEFLEMVFSLFRPANDDKGDGK